MVSIIYLLHQGIIQNRLEVICVKKSLNSRYVSVLSITIIVFSLIALLMCDVHAEIQSGIVADGVYALKKQSNRAISGYSIRFSK